VTISCIISITVEHNMVYLEALNEELQ